MLNAKRKSEYQWHFASNHWALLIVNELTSMFKIRVFAADELVGRKYSKYERIN